MVFISILALVGISLIVATFLDMEDESRIRDVDLLRKMCKLKKIH